MNLAKGVDLLIGVCLSINLGQVPKIHRDTRERSARPEGVMAHIDRRMDDARHSIMPQFSVAHSNFPRIPLTDRSISAPPTSPRRISAW